MQLFLDNSNSILSIHNICKAGVEKYRAHIKAFWTPLTALLAARDTIHKSTHALGSRLHFITFHNNSLNFKEIIPSFRSDRNLIVLLIGMFGDSHVDEPNFRILKECLMLRQTLGMIGGIGHKAMYIIGFTGDEFLVLDPHYTQEVH